MLLHEARTLCSVHDVNLTLRHLRWRDAGGADATLCGVGTFTVLDAKELAALADVFQLGDVSRSRPIAAGTINSNFEVETSRGRFFLRVNEGKSEADVAWEAHLVATLAAAGVATPTPLTGRDRRAYTALPNDPNKWVSAFGWRGGSHLASDAVTPVHAERFGAALATLHVAGLAIPPHQRRRSIYDHEHLLARFQSIASVGDPALAHATAILGEELALAGRVAAVRAAATHGIIHGDLFRDNVLWEGDRISAILDFEQASGGSLSYDVAVCLNDWCWTRGPRPDLADALLSGYQSVRALTAADREALPYEVRAAATRFTITRITDVYLAKVPNPEKDFRDFLARVESWRGESLQLLTRSS
jgi:homoserine kinase type II